MRPVSLSLWRGRADVRVGLTWGGCLETAVVRGGGAVRGARAHRVNRMSAAPTILNTQLIVRRLLNLMCAWCLVFGVSELFANQQNIYKEPHCTRTVAWGLGGRAT